MSDPSRDQEEPGVLLRLMHEAAEMAQAVGSPGEMAWPVVWVIDSEGQETTNVLQQADGVPLASVVRLIVYGSRAAYAVFAVETYVTYIQEGTAEAEAVKAGLLHPRDIRSGERTEVLWICGESRWGTQIDWRWRIHPPALPGFPGAAGARTYEQLPSWQQEDAPGKPHPFRPLFYSAAQMGPLLASLRDLHMETTEYTGVTEESLHRFQQEGQPPAGARRRRTRHYHPHPPGNAHGNPRDS